MNKLIIALGFTLAASTGAFAASTAMDAYDVPSAQGNTNYAVGVSNDLVSYHRAGHDGSPSFAAPQGGVDYTPTASFGTVSNDQVIYDRAGNDGSPRFH
ncbi:hypothetical protein OEG84_07200 [Hoeflea sp. G2-23]|uniref:Uncharacterized protein n=1 Tax=Hoeflea algicola TaxID=2983763 RepID=A0ABT3Z6Y0_9HYPH|nr:hypothetical protein [Hoeflea algicola]MCY0147505.1 hypothetical protein [Hoeflea algicola]